MPPQQYFDPELFDDELYDADVLDFDTYDAALLQPQRTL